MGGDEAVGAADLGGVSWGGYGVDLGEGGREGGKEVTYVDNSGGPELGPGVVVRQVLEIVPRALDEGTHGAAETLGALRVLREKLVDRLVGAIRQRESLHPYPHASTTVIPITLTPSCKTRHFVT